MGCAGCSVKTKDGSPIGCRSNGNCSTGGCNRLNTFDWLSAMEIEDVEPFNIIEVSFKNGARKSFYYNQPYTRASTGDMVVVESQAGSDVGRVSLTGELVRMQMRKKKVKEDNYFPKVIRIANERDLEKYAETKERERPMMVRARAISRTLDLNMKIGDVEVQGDGRKATFYYTADGRVDFRELIRHFAKEFKLKIEMRQIGARQESARIGGLGPCGRELCCSTWLTSYKTVSTAAARYQNLAINQAKLSGQCGRLKCCLNYELDTYMEALSNFPDDAEKLQTEEGRAILLKTDIFKGIMYYGYEKEGGRGRFYPLDLEQVREVREMNQNGKRPTSLAEVMVQPEYVEEPIQFSDDVTGFIELPSEERRRKKKKRPERGNPKTRDQKPADRAARGDRQRERPNTPTQGERKGPPSNRSKDGGKTASAKDTSAPPAAKGSQPGKDPDNRGGNNRPPKGRGPKSKYRGNRNKGGNKNTPKDK
ncbi:MAG: regulatory iron-sulfur-containing complex subunit RicT [Saprospiraceae bacterium]